MKRILVFLMVAGVFCILGGAANGRGWGGGGRGFGGGGGYRGGFSGGFDRGYGGTSGFDRGFGSDSGMYRGPARDTGASTNFDRNYGGGFSSFNRGNDLGGGTYSGVQTFGSKPGWSGLSSAGNSYDHSWTDSRGGSINTSGERGAAVGPNGGFAAGGTRDTTVTTAGGKTVSADSQRGVASGPMGRTVGGGSGTVDGPRGTNSWQSAFAGNRYTGDMAHYSSVYGANGVHSTAYWSNGYMGVHAGYVRTGFGYYGCFNPGWYGAHPGCWVAAGWAADAAWNAATYNAVADYCGLVSTAMPDYDYGSTVVIQDNNIYMNGTDTGTVQQYAEQATTIAAQGQTANPPTTDNWKPLGVYALVQGDAKTSNNIFQLAVNKDGIIRGNYYDGLLNTTTEVYGSIDKQTQRAAWTIGKTKDRIFDAGIYNLTQPQCPCLVHIGTTSTEQLMLVRVEQPKKTQ